MAIQNRRGVYSDFTPTKMVPGEFAVVNSGDPNSTSGKGVYMSFADGQAKRLVMEEDVQNEVAKATEDIAQELTQEVEAAIADDVQAAQTAATNASTSAQTATTKASEAAASATQAAQTVANIIDNTLTQTGKAADAKVTGDELEGLKEDLKVAVGVIDEDVTQSFISGKYITTNLSVGATVDVENPVTSSGFSYVICKCRAGDTFRLTGKGGSAPRLWAFTDNDYILLSKSSSTLRITNLTLTAEEDGYIIINADRSTPYELLHSYIYESVKGKIDSLDERTVLLESDVSNLSDSLSSVLQLNTFANKANNPIELILSRVVFPKNVYKNTDYTTGYYLKPNGTLEETESGYSVSDYFMIKPNTVYCKRNSNFVICFYDYDKNYISGLNTFNAGIFTSPQNACYARASTNAAVLTWNISEGDEVDSTASYFDPYINFDNEFNNSPYYKGKMFISKPEVSGFYTCECLKEDPDIFGFELGTNAAYTGTQYAEMIAKWDSLIDDAESGYVTKTALGTGAGTDINGNSYTLYEYAFVPRECTHSKINKIRPKILIDCGIHGFEKNSVFGMFVLMYDVVHNWQKNPFLTTLRNSVEIRIIPIVNPWGFDNNARNNYNNVNLNRNFPAENWLPGEGSDYGGETPLDQPEAEIVADWMESNKDAWFYFNLHTNGHYNASGYAEANALMPFSVINDTYYLKMYNAFGKHIIDQTALLPTEYNVLTPSIQNKIGKIQEHTDTSSGFASTYVSGFKKWMLSMTLEGFNHLTLDGGQTSIMNIHSGISTKCNAEIFGNVIRQLLYEYLDV